MPPVDSEQRAGRFRLLTRLGSGGMGDVYLALARGPVGFEKLQVLKFLRDDLEVDESRELLRMFEDEARIAARLNHPHVVQCHEVAFDNDRPYLAMEYLDGQPLSRIQRRAQQGATGWTLAMRLLVLSQVLDALEYAHGLRDYDGSPLHIVHRDVSPDNVFVTYAGQVKLVDFGIAKTLHSRRTQTGVVKGKIEYMAPEQVQAEPVDARADLYAVGVMLWEAVAGEEMHSSTMAPFMIMQRVVEGDLPRLDALVRDANPELCAVVERALSLRPEDRFESATAMRAALFAVMERMPRVEPRLIGAWVAEAFSVERAAVSSVIRRASATASGSRANESGGFHDDDADYEPATRALPVMAETAMPPVSDAAGHGVTDSYRATEPLVATPPTISLPVTAPSGPRWLGLVWPIVVGALALGALSIAYRLSTGASPTFESRLSLDPPSAVERPAAQAPFAVPTSPARSVPVQVTSSERTGQVEDNDRTRSTETLSAEAGVAAPAGTSVAAPAGTILLRVTTQPSRARLFLNGVRVDNPYQRSHPVGAVLRFRAQASGYRRGEWHAALDELDPQTARLGKLQHTLTLARSPAWRARYGSDPERDGAAETSPRSRPSTPRAGARNAGPYERFELDP